MGREGHLPLPQVRGHRLLPSSAGGDRGHSLRAGLTAGQTEQRAAGQAQATDVREQVSTVTHNTQDQRAWLCFWMRTCVGTQGGTDPFERGSVDRPPHPLRGSRPGSRMESALAPSPAPTITPDLPDWAPVGTALHCPSGRCQGAAAPGSYTMQEPAGRPQRQVLPSPRLRNDSDPAELRIPPCELSPAGGRASFLRGASKCPLNHRDSGKNLSPNPGLSQIRKHIYLNNFE